MAIRPAGKASTIHMYEEFGFKDKMLVIRGDYNQRLTAAINVVDNMLNLPQK